MRVAGGPRAGAHESDHRLLSRWPFDCAKGFQVEQLALIVVAGKAYVTGASRDWDANGLIKGRDRRGAGRRAGPSD